MPPSKEDLLALLLRPGSIAPSVSLDQANDLWAFMKTALTLWPQITPAVYMETLAHIHNMASQGTTFHHATWNTFVAMAPTCSCLLAALTMPDVPLLTMGIGFIPIRPATLVDVEQLFALVRKQLSPSTAGVWNSICQMALTLPPHERMSALHVELQLLQPFSYIATLANIETAIHPIVAQEALEFALQSPHDTVFWNDIGRKLSKNHSPPILCVSQSVRAFMLASCPPRLRTDLIQAIGRAGPIADIGPAR